jgi:hypothetical protein
VRPSAVVNEMLRDEWTVATAAERGEIVEAA